MRHHQGGRLRRPKQVPYATVYKKEAAAADCVRPSRFGRRARFGAARVPHPAPCSVVVRLAAGVVTGGITAAVPVYGGLSVRIDQPIFCPALDGAFHRLAPRLVLLGFKWVHTVC